MSKNQFLENFYMLKNDLELLSKNNILAGDLRFTKNDNMRMYDMFVRSFLRRVSCKFPNQISDWIISDKRIEIIEKNMRPNDTVKEFVKKNELNFQKKCKDKQKCLTFLIIYDSILDVWRPHIFKPHRKG